MTDRITIERVLKLDADMLSRLQALIAQLSASSKMPSAADLEEIIASSSTRLYVAKCNNAIVGMLTLVVIRIPTGVRAHIEDVVVAASNRRQGIGGMLTESAVSDARMSGARTLDLTSRPSRVEANRLYQNLGFARRDTHVYRLQMAEP
jgi:ribosomal protein S18 acetylase RimI-like enzyme